MLGYKIVIFVVKKQGLWQKLMLTLKKFLEVCVGVGELIGSCEFCIIFINIVSTLKSVFS